MGGILLCRGAVGAALGGLLPASFAMLADFYPAEERPHAVALVDARWGQSGGAVGSWRHWGH